MECQRGKCDEKSKQFLVEGDEFRDESKYSDAIIAYNKSLCFRETKSSNATLAFCRRSEVYFLFGDAQRCLENIKLARQHKCSVDESRQLNEREKICKKLLSQQEPSENDPWNFFRLSYPPHKNVPFIADCLKLNETWKYGRGIVATKCLKAGDIIAIEEPLYRMINKSSRYSRCANCMKSNKMSLIPCPGKCTSTMFCSAICLESGWKRFHKYECNALDQSFSNDNEYDILILKIVFESLKFSGSLEKLENLVADPKLNVTVFDLDLKSKKEDQTEKNLLKAIYSLKKGPTSDEDIAMADWIVDSHPVLVSTCKLSAQREFLRNFVIKIMGIIDRNSYIFYSPSMKMNEEIGSGVFPFASLMNHSCSPNIYRIFVDNKQVFIVKKPIPVGQQLFVGYQANFTFAPKQSRQECLIKDFHFKCGCDACTNDYPLMQDLKRCDLEFRAPLENADSVMKAKEILKQNNEYIEKMTKKLPFPCYEICSTMQNSFKQLQYIASKSFILEKTSS